MADLRDEIADIVVPVAPASVPAAAATTPGLVAGGFVVAAGVLLLLAWMGWRARPARALAAIAAATSVYWYWMSMMPSLLPCLVSNTSL